MSSGRGLFTILLCILLLLMIITVCSIGEIPHLGNVWRWCDCIEWKWGSQGYNYILKTTPGYEMSESEAKSAIESAFDKWVLRAPGNYLSYFDIEGSTNSIITWYNEEWPGHYESGAETWVEEDAEGHIWMFTTWLRGVSRIVQDTTYYIAWSDECNDSTINLQTVMLHEVGHVFGFDEASPPEQSVMDPSIKEATECYTDITSDDMEALIDVYGRNIRSKIHVFDYDFSMLYEATFTLTADYDILNSIADIEINWEVTGGGGYGSRGLESQELYELTTYGSTIITLDVIILQPFRLHLSLKFRVLFLVILNQYSYECLTFDAGSFGASFSSLHTTLCLDCIILSRGNLLLHPTTIR
jgi:hypothetical protein